MKKRQQLNQLILEQQNIVTAAHTAGRELTAEETRSFNSLQGRIDTLKTEADAEDEAEREAERKAIRQQAVENERQRTAEIGRMCRGMGADAEQFISEGKTVEEVREALIDNQIKSGSPQGMHVRADEEDKFRAAAADGLLSRTGISLDKPADGARDFMAMSLRDLAIECAVRDHNGSERDLRHTNSDELYAQACRDFYNPTSSFPAIMDTAIKKSIVHTYNQTNTTFDKITKKGTLKDFKRTDGHDYLIGGVGDLLKVGENGELKADNHSEEMLPQRKLDTYGRQFSMSRQAFINDDIGFLSEVPGMYSAKSKRQINKAVYSILYNNGAIYDGKTLFNDDHKNLMKTASAPSSDAIQKMINKLMMQKDQFGESIIVTPENIVVPSGYGFMVNTIFRSATINTAGNTQAANPLYDPKIEVVEDPTLNALAGTNACPWFMKGAQTDVSGIQVDYLNGQETPTFRRMEAPGVLGFTWDIYLDWAITVMDFRGFVKNPGIVLDIE